jgi:transposase
MELIYERCCGIDVHKKKLSVCFFVDKKKEKREYGTMTDNIEKLMEWLKSEDCQAVAMESTGVYWKPIYNILEEGGMKVIVCNAQHIKGVPGRKTDVRDSEWIADLVRHGLVKSSYIPNREDRELREIVRYRRSIVQERARELNRIQAVLEGANIKLASVISHIDGVSGIAILKAMVKGQTNPEELLKVTTGLLKADTDVLLGALKGSIGVHQQQMLKLQLEHLTCLDKQIQETDEIIKKKTETEELIIERLDEMKGIGRRSAEQIIAEIGIDMDRFPSADHLASWCGLSPGSNESAGKKKSSKMRNGNKHIRTTMIECAKAAVKSPNTFWCAKYSKLVVRRGANRATAAVARAMIVAIYYMLKRNEPFNDLGADYYFAQDEEKVKNKLIKNLGKLGYDVTLTPQVLIT